MISTLLLTYQEERNLPRCLRALDWCDDIVVVDSFSTDGTVEIARAHGARVIQRAFDDFAGQRNFGLTHGELRHDWVLHLDADEVVTPTLRDELLLLARHPTHDAFLIPARLMFRGVWLKHAALPSYQVRFGHRAKLRFEQVGHGQREKSGTVSVGMARGALEHYSLDKGLSDWIGRHNRYSSDEARHALLADGQPRLPKLDLTTLRDPMMRFRILKRLASRLPFRSTLRFLYMYLARLGFLDGRAGYDYCRLMAWYEFLVAVKIRELRHDLRSTTP